MRRILFLWGPVEKLESIMESFPPLHLFPLCCPAIYYAKIYRDQLWGTLAAQTPTQHLAVVMRHQFLRFHFIQHLKFVIPAFSSKAQTISLHCQHRQPHKLRTRCRQCLYTASDIWPRQMDTRHLDCRCRSECRKQRRYRTRQTDQTRYRSDPEELVRLGP